jgi:tetratricopeptide (TPR) repeat protein
MLYSFLPPVLIVFSLAGIILFLIKKSEKVAELSMEEIIREEEEKMILMEDTGFLKRINLRVKNIKGDDIKHCFLALLEKITSKSRVIFLKLESKFGNWSVNIRKKRKAKVEGEVIANNLRKKDSDIIQKLREYKLKKSIFGGKNEKVKTEADVVEISKSNKIIEKKIISARSDSLMFDKEKIVRPIISEKIVRPRKQEIKDRLEELLIERIAVNPKDIEAYERLGQYYMEIKSYGDAKECFKQVIKFDSGNRNAKYRLKRLENLLNQ